MNKLCDQHIYKGYSTRQLIQVQVLHNLSPRSPQTLHFIINYHRLCFLLSQHTSNFEIVSNLQIQVVTLKMGSKDHNMCLYFALCIFISRL